MEAIVALLKEERESIKKRSSKRKFKSYIHRLQDELEDDKEQQRGLSMCQDLSVEEKKFVMSFNSKVRHNKDTSGLNVPSKFKEVINNKKKVTRKIGFNLDLNEPEENDEE
eukprot:4449373-Ditylum_brightwellii.AAC.1